MPAATGPHRIAACIVGVAAVWLAPFSPAAAQSPINDPLVPSLAPAGGELAPPSNASELATPDQAALQHQMGLTAGFADFGPGLHIVPRLSMDEIFNDNVLDAHSPRRWDLITEFAPGVAVSDQTDRIQLRLNYQPTLQVYARTGSENALTHQLNAAGTVTLVPNELFVDIRGLAGVQATNGGLGGLGGLGAGNLAPVTSPGFLQTAQIGQSKQLLTQTSSFAISPYLLHQFGSTGAARIAVSLNETSLSQLNGFTAAPWDTGPNAQRQTGLQESASFQTGSEFARLRDTVQASAGQSHTDSTGQNGSSENEDFNNRVDYAVDQSVAVFGELGWENIHYSGANRLKINGPTWGIGVTWTPDPDTSVVFAYRHQDGSTGFSFSGHYALSARTTLTGSYNTSIGTQSDLLSGQLGAAAVNNSGGLVNSTTGGSLFNANNALGVAPGLYRFNVLSLGATTVLERDTVTLSFSRSSQTPIGTGISGVASDATTGGVSWTHLLNPDVSLNASAYLSTGTPSGNVRQNSLAASLGGQYRLSETVSAFARYAFFDRQSPKAQYSMYQDLLLVGVTKQF